MRPVPALAPYIDHYWVTRWDRRGHPPRTAATLLEPCVHLQIRAGRAEIMGVVRGRYRMAIAGVGCVVGVRFRPGGFYPFVHQPIAKWTDRTVSAEEALGTAGLAVTTWARALYAEIDDCRDDADAHAAIVARHLDEHLGTLLRDRDVVAEVIADAVATLAARDDVGRVHDLSRACGCSERTLYRLFVRYVGISPGWVLRRYRLHAVAMRLTTDPDTSIPALAYEFGYSDQAHLIRDFRKSVGVTPGAYARSLA